MREQGFERENTFFYVIKDGTEMYRFDNERFLAQALAHNSLPPQFRVYLFPLHEGLRWAGPAQADKAVGDEIGRILADHNALSQHVGAEPDQQFRAAARCHRQHERHSTL